jgi:hypothetical protein
VFVLISGGIRGKLEESRMFLQLFDEGAISVGRENPGAPRSGKKS